MQSRTASAASAAAEAHAARGRLGVRLLVSPRGGACRRPEMLSPFVAGRTGGRKAAPSSLVTHYSEQFTAFPTVPAVPTPSRFVVPELHTLRVPQQRTLQDGVSTMESNGERACPIDTGEISSSAWRASERQSPLIFGGARYAHRLPVYPSYDYAMCSCEFWFSVVRRRVLATCRASGSAHRALPDARRVARLALVGDSSSFFLDWVLLNCG